MIEKIKYWLFQKGKDCKRYCLRCRYYDICRWDVLGNAGLARMDAINNNATPEIKEQLKEGNLGITAAYEAEVTGKIKTGSYESQRTGSKVYYTEVVANSVGFGESKAEAEARGQQLPESDGFMNIPEGADEELPFN